MTTDAIANVTLTTKASVYFEGKCVSHGFALPDGTKKSVGVVLPAELTFNTGAAEIMECVAGGCGTGWPAATNGQSGPGERFSIPANSSFNIRVREAYHCICHFG